MGSESSLVFWDQRCISREIFFSPMSLGPVFFLNSIWVASDAATDAPVGPFATSWPWPWPCPPDGVEEEGAERAWSGSYSATEVLGVGKVADGIADGTDGIADGIMEGTLAGTEEIEGE